LRKVKDKNIIESIFLVFMRTDKREYAIILDKNCSCRRMGFCSMYIGIMLMVLLLLQPLISYAKPSMHLTLDEIIVVADSIKDPASTSVGLKTIEQGKNITIPDALKDEPDIDIRQRAIVGDTSDTLAIRGFSGNRIMLNINERPVNSAGVAGGYYIDWGTIPLDNIEKIEIIRGGSSVRYGNNALGGVINVITKKPTDTPTFTIFGNYGSGEDIDSLANVRLTHTHKTGILGYSIGVSFQKSDPFLWNNDFNARNLAVSAYVDMPYEGELTFGLQYAYSERGLIRENRLSDNPDDQGFYVKLNRDSPLALGETFDPYSGNAFIPGPGANWDKTKWYLDLGYTQPVGDSLIELKLYKNHEDRKEKNYSSSAINSFYSDGLLVLDRSVESDRSYGGNIQVTMPFDSHQFFAGVEHKVLAYGDTIVNYLDEVYNNWWEPVTGYAASQEGVKWGYYGQDTWQARSRLTFTIGLRFDRYYNKSINAATMPELKDDALTPKVIGTYRVTDKDTITLSLYQALRTPGLPETYWWAEGATCGRPVLNPEKNNAIEFTYQRDFSQTDFLRLSAYHYRVDDYIMFRFDPNWKGVYNIDQVVQSGASAAGRKTFLSRLSGKASVTWQKNRKEADIYDTEGLSDRLDYTPEWKASAGVEFSLPYQSILNLVGRYVGERQTIYSYSYGWPSQYGFKLIKLDPYVTVDMDLKIPVTRYGEFCLYVENLFDEDYDQQYGYPMPGILLGAAIKILF
jgi:outer membrane receptor protein involved in Fe transport